MTVNCISSRRRNDVFFFLLLMLLQHSLQLSLFEGSKPWEVYIQLVIYVQPSPRRVSLLINDGEESLCVGLEEDGNRLQENLPRSLNRKGSTYLSLFSTFSVMPRYAALFEECEYAGWAFDVPCRSKQVL